MDTILPFFKSDHSHASRYKRVKDNYSDFLSMPHPTYVHASNTYPSSLATQFLVDGFVTKLQNRLAALRAFSTEFKPDPLKPLVTTNLKLTTGTDGVVQQNATNWETGDSTVTDVQTGPVQYSRSFHVDNEELNSGMRMDNIIEVNSAVFGDAIMQAGTAPMTAANFQNVPMVSSSGNWGYGNMQTLWGMLKKSSVKNLILDGEYIAQLLNLPTNFQRTGTQPGEGWKDFGWDEVLMNTNWTGADPNVRGFACNPQAIVTIAGLPLSPLSIPGATVEMTTVKIPGPDIYIQFSRWFNVSTRTLWFSFDVVFSASALDTTAGILIKSQ